MSLTDAQLQAAVAYNRARPYDRDTWRRIQAVVGAQQDGIPGPETTRAAAVFQASRGLVVDGKVGPATLAAMGLGQPATRTRFTSLPGESVFFFHGRMSINADGAPNAYNEQDTGIDYLANAGRPGNWWALACDAGGVPYKQGPDDPFPGYYVSMTALFDRQYAQRDPRRYVDATQIPFLVLPRNVRDLHDVGSLRLGDLGVVLRLDQPETLIFTLYADVGPTWSADKLHGEGSIALAEALGHNPWRNNRAAIGISNNVFYVVFPGSGDRAPLPAADIEHRGQQAFDAWGGRPRLERAIGASR